MKQLETERDGYVMNITDALFEIADAINALSRAVKYLGNGDATTSFGAIEGLSMQIKEGLEVAGSSIADSITTAGESLFAEVRLQETKTEATNGHARQGAM